MSYSHRTDLTKSSTGHKILCDSVEQPYQGLLADFNFSDKIRRDKDKKVIESSQADEEGINDDMYTA